MEAETHRPTWETLLAFAIIYFVWGSDVRLPGRRIRRRCGQDESGSDSRATWDRERAEPVRVRPMSKETTPPNGEIILYQTEDGRTRVECRFEQEMLWMSQTLMAELFQTGPQNITLHLKALCAEGEIDEAATCKEYLQVVARVRAR
jgi:hypothetical protein